MQNANGKCNRLSVKPFIATALLLLNNNCSYITYANYSKLLSLGHNTGRKDKRTHFASTTPAPRQKYVPRQKPADGRLD